MNRHRRTLLASAILASGCIASLALAQPSPMGPNGEGFAPGMPSAPTPQVGQPGQPLGQPGMASGQPVAPGGFGAPETPPMGQNGEGFAPGASGAPTPQADQPAQPGPFGQPGAVPVQPGFPGQPVPAPGFDPAMAGQAQPPTEVRVYPVGDLLTVSSAPAADPRQPAAGGMPGGQPPGGGNNSLFAGGGEGASTPSSPNREERVQFLTKLLEEMVAVDTWRDNGGTVGSIREFDSNFIVSQTAQNHEEIAKILAQLRHGPGQIHLQGMWIEMAASDMEEMSKVDGTVRVLPSNAAVIAKALQSVELTTYSGQSINLHSGSNIPYVSDLEPVVGNSAVGFDPTISFIRTGIQLTGNARLLSPETARLDLRASMITLHEMKSYPVLGSAGGPTSTGITFNAPQPGATTGVTLNTPADPAAQNGQSVKAAGFIQQPVVDERAFDTRVDVPIGKYVVVGGLSTNQTGDASGKVCYFVVIVQGK